MAKHKPEYRNPNAQFPNRCWAKGDYGREKLRISNMGIADIPLRVTQLSTYEWRLFDGAGLGITFLFWPSTWRVENVAKLNCGLIKPPTSIAFDSFNEVIDHCEKLIKRASKP